MPTALSGSCAYPNQWTGGESCVEYRGAGWAEADMVASCAAQPGGGTLSVGSEASHHCPLPAGGRLAGLPHTPVVEELMRDGHVRSVQLTYSVANVLLAQQLWGGHQRGKEASGGLGG